jgi:hypothetical protein
MAQSAPTKIDANNAGGVQPYNTYGGTHENINLATGDLNLQIPLVSLPGRDGFDLNLSLVYDSKIWNLHGVRPMHSINAVYWWDDITNPSGEITSANLDLAWRYNIPTLYSTLVTTGSGASTTYCYGNFVVVTADGGKHPFSSPAVPTLNGVRAGCYIIVNGVMVPQPQMDLLVGGAVDSTYLVLDTTISSDVVVHIKDGTTIHFPSYNSFATIPSRIQDTNGNQISYQFSGSVLTITDTLGRVVTSTTNSASSRTISYKDSTGTQRSIALTLSQVNIAPTFTNPPGAGVPASSNQYMLQTITTPNNLTYSFAKLVE